MSHLIKKKRGIVAGLVTVILLIGFMLFTTPTKEEFDKWILKEDGIVCDNLGTGEECTKDNQLIWEDSSHFRDMGIFASYEKRLELENGNQSTHRVMGIYGNLFFIKDGKVWEILN